MGENEQSGMLRVVVVMALVAIVAAASIFGVVALKSKIHDQSNKVTRQVTLANAIDVDDDLMTANSKAKGILAIDQDAVESQSGYTDNENNQNWTWKNASNGAKPSIISDGYNGQKAVTASNNFTSPSLLIPNAASNVHIDFWVKWGPYGQAWVISDPKTNTMVTWSGFGEEVGQDGSWYHIKGDVPVSAYHGKVIKATFNAQWVVSNFSMTFS